MSLCASCSGLCSMLQLDHPGMQMFGEGVGPARQYVDMHMWNRLARRQAVLHGNIERSRSMESPYEPLSRPYCFKEGCELYLTEFL